MDPAASSSQLSQYVMTIIFVIHISDTCKSSKPKVIASSTMAPDNHPLDWPNAVQQDGLADTGASNPISLKCLSQQYINNIRLASNSLSIILEKLREQAYKDSSGRTQTTMHGLITSQKKLTELFEIASVIFPLDLDNSVNAIDQSHASDQDWEDIEFTDIGPKIRQVGLEHLFSKEYYANKPTFKSKVNLTWSKLPRTLTSRYVRHGHTPSTVQQDLLFNNAHPKAADNSTKNLEEA